MMNKVDFRSCKAFTFLELLLVVMFLAGAALVAVPNFSKFVRHFEFQRTTQDLVSAVRLAQLRAMTKGRAVQVVIDPQGYWIEEDRSRNALALDVQNQPKFERLKNRFGLRVRWPKEMRISPAQAQVVLSSDGRMDSPDLELCRAGDCLILTASRSVGQLDILDPRRENDDVVP